MQALSFPSLQAHSISPLFPCTRSIDFTSSKTPQLGSSQSTNYSSTIRLQGKSQNRFETFSIVRARKVSLSMSQSRARLRVLSSNCCTSFNTSFLSSIPSSSSPTSKTNFNRQEVPQAHSLVMSHCEPVMVGRRYRDSDWSFLGVGASLQTPPPRYEEPMGLSPSPSPFGPGYAVRRRSSEPQFGFSTSHRAIEEFGTNLATSLHPPPRDISRFEFPVHTSGSGGSYKIIEEDMANGRPLILTRLGTTIEQHILDSPTLLQKPYPLPRSTLIPTFDVIPSMSYNRGDKSNTERRRAGSLRQRLKKRKETKEERETMEKGKKGILEFFGVRRIKSVK